MSRIRALTATHFQRGMRCRVLSGVRRYRLHQPYSILKTCIICSSLLASGEGANEKHGPLLYSRDLTLIASQLCASVRDIGPKKRVF